MTVSASANASARVLGSAVNPTSATTIYTAKGYTANVTSDTGATSGTSGTGPATAYVKEIIICNTTTSPINATVIVNGITIISNAPINGSDTKPIGGLNTMISAGQTIVVSASASGLSFLVSGVEVQ